MLGNGRGDVGRGCLPLSDCGPARVTVGPKSAVCPLREPTERTSPLPKPERHFTDLPSGLAIEVRDRVLCVEGAGFVTRTLAEESLRPFLSAGPVPDSVLVDLRNVSGYQADSTQLAQSMLAQARGFGVRRIALVANSSILRTAAEVIAQHLHAPLHTFESREGAQSWLADSRNGVVQQPVSDPSSSPTARA